MFSPKKSLH